MILKTLISFFRCVWLGLEINSAGHQPSRTEVAYHWATVYITLLLVAKSLNENALARYTYGSLGGDVGRMALKCAPDAVRAVARARIYPSIPLSLFLFPFRRQCLREVRNTWKSIIILKMRHAEAPKGINGFNWSWITYIFDILTPVVKDIFDKS